MIFRVTMKTPDCLGDAINDALNAHIESGEIILNGEYPDMEKELRFDSIITLCKEKWFRYGEYVTLEIDTEKQTCIVVEV